MHSALQNCKLLILPKNPKVKRSRVRTIPVRKWTDTESLSMLHYILDKLNDGKPFEVKSICVSLRKVIFDLVNFSQKPTAEIYYYKMIQKLEMKDVSWQQL